MYNNLEREKIVWKTIIFFVRAYFCLCPAGYSGDSCEQDVDDCANQPCANHGKCIDQINYYICECQPGFIGEKVFIMYTDSIV